MNIASAVNVKERAVECERFPTPKLCVGDRILVLLNLSVSFHSRRFVSPFRFVVSSSGVHFPPPPFTIFHEPNCLVDVFNSHAILRGNGPENQPSRIAPSVSELEGEVWYR